MRACAIVGALVCVIGAGACGDGSSSGDESRGKADRAKAASFLSAAEAQNVLDSIDAICGDTFCAGDFDYHPKEIRCTAANGVCEVTFLVESYYDDQKFPATALDNVDRAKLKTQGTGDSGPFTGEVLALDGDQLRFSCALSGEYKSLSDVMERPQAGPDSLADKFYSHILDCTDAMEKIFRPLQPQSK
jgi:hypothetical protein